MKLKAHLTFFNSILRLPHFHSIIHIFLVDGAGCSQQVGFAKHVSTVMHARKLLNSCATNFYFQNWEQNSVAKYILVPFTDCTFAPLLWSNKWCPAMLKWYLKKLGIHLCKSLIFTLSAMMDKICLQDLQWSVLL